MKKILLVIDYQKAFKNENSSKTINQINKVATARKWDSIIQTMWFNSQDTESLYLLNLNYNECDPYSNDSGLVKRFDKSVVMTRYDKYSCVDEELARKLHGDVVIYIIGWETDACVLGTCFDLFDRGINFKVVKDCVKSEHEDVHKAALRIIERNFGKDCLITSEEIK